MTPDMRGAAAPGWTLRSFAILRSIQELDSYQKPSQRTTGRCESAGSGAPAGSRGPQSACRGNPSPGRGGQSGWRPVGEIGSRPADSPPSDLGEHEDDATWLDPASHGAWHTARHARRARAAICLSSWPRRGYRWRSSCAACGGAASRTVSTFPCLPMDHAPAALSTHQLARALTRLGEGRVTSGAYLVLGIGPLRS